MRRMTTGLVAALFATGALAQWSPPGGGGGPPGGGGGGGGPPGSGRPPRVAATVKREALDKPVTAMFRAADTDRNGRVTLEEIRAIIGTRRDTLIRARFDRVDGDHDGIVSLAEFTAWQRDMGSAALSENQPPTDGGGPIPETIEPDLGKNPEERVLRLIIEPLSALTVVNANSDHGVGITLQQLLAYQRGKFDAADKDGDGQLSMEELRELNRRQGEAGFGGPGRPEPMRRPD